MKALLERLRRSLPGRVAEAYARANVGSYAAALAFNSFMTMFPLMLGLLAIVGLLVRNQEMQARAQSLLISAFPADAQSQLADALQGVKQNVGLLGLVALAGLLWGGTNFFTMMEFALTQAQGIGQRSFLRQRLMGGLMMLIFLAALLLTGVANALVGGSSVPGRIAGLASGVAILFLLLLAVYRLVPNWTFTVKQVWPGALIGGVTIEALTLAFPIYANLTQGFNTYGRQFGLFFLLATWLYLLSQVLLVGALVNYSLAGAPNEPGIVAEPKPDSAPDIQAPPGIEHQPDSSRLHAGEVPAAPTSPAGRPSRPS